MIIWLIVLIVVALSYAGWFIANMVGKGYSSNPLRWAQERRARENVARQVRIIYLEHDLGLHADRVDDCIECHRNVEREFDKKYLSRDVIEVAYDRSVMWNSKTVTRLETMTPPPPPPPPFAQPDSIRK